MKSLQEIKTVVAKKYRYNEWDDLLNKLDENGLTDRGVWDEAAELYASQKIQSLEHELSEKKDRLNRESEYVEKLKKQIQERDERIQVLEEALRNIKQEVAYLGTPAARNVIGYADKALSPVESKN